MAQLIKHPAEVRRYTFDFGTSEGSGAGRGATWAARMLDTTTGERFQGQQSLLLLLFPSVADIDTPTPQFEVIRDDGGSVASLTISDVQISSSKITAMIGGGEAEKSYRITCYCPTNTGATYAVQGTLLVSRTIS